MKSIQTKDNSKETHSQLKKNFIPISYQEAESKKESSHFKECLTHLHYRQSITPNQSIRKSPLRKCESVVQTDLTIEDTLHIKDECDLEIMDILGCNMSDVEYHHNILDFNLDDEDNDDHDYHDEPERPHCVFLF